MFAAPSPHAGLVAWLCLALLWLGVAILVVRFARAVCRWERDSRPLPLADALRRPIPSAPRRRVDPSPIPRSSRKSAA